MLPGGTQLRNQPRISVHLGIELGGPQYAQGTIREMLIPDLRETGFHLIPDLGTDLRELQLAHSGHISNLSQLLQVAEN